VQLRLAEGPNGAEQAKTSDALAVDVQADWQFWAGGTDVTDPGCYAYQVDGSGFTETIVFRAELGPDGRRPYRSRSRRQQHQVGPDQTEGGFQLTSQHRRL
jgi:hypothetical protein